MQAPTKDNSIAWSELTHFNDKQKEAEKAVKGYKYILYGGAMGGGKSYWLRWMLVKLLLEFHFNYGLRGVRVGLFCEDYPSLDDRHLTKIQYELPSWLGHLNKGDKNFTLAPEYGSGVISFRNLDDASKYASSEFAVVAVDELTKNQKIVFDMLRTRMRWKGIPDTKFLAGTNPGSVGHAWVKKIWMDREFELTEKEAHLFKYIRATADDNRMNLDDSYFQQLEGLPEEKRKAFLMGDWNLFEGQFFSEFNVDIHVVEPFQIPDTWRKFGGYDHGRAKPACFKWYALDFDGNVYCYRELYVNKEDGSSRYEADQIAREVVRINKEANDFLEYVVADSAIFMNTGTGETIAEILQKNGVGKSGTLIPQLIPCQKGAGSRVNGWAVMHQFLYYDKLTNPKLRYFSTCVDSIRTIPSLVYSDIHVEDLDTDGEDHAADVDRYFLQTLRNKKTKPPKTREEKKIVLFQKKQGLVSDDITRLDRFANL
jgi:phage terminase large subunit